MTLTPHDLVFCAANHLGTPLLGRAEAAAAAGFDAVSLMPHEVAMLRNQGMTDHEIRSRIADAGVTLSEMDAITTWLPGHTPPASLPRDVASGLAANTAEAVCPVAGALGARSVTVVEFYGDRPDTDAAAEAFARVCDVAADNGLIAHLEFLPWAGISTLAEALEVVRRADRPNGGLLVDSWHFFRSGATLDQLRAVPGDLVKYVQIDDAPAAPEADLSEETQHRRMLPGDGDLDLVGLVRTLDEIGCQAPIGAEVFSDELGAQPIDDVAAKVAASTRSVLAAARGT